MRVANYQGRGAVGGIALIARLAVEEREKGWKKIPRLGGAWLHCTVLTLEGDLHSRRQSSLVAPRDLRGFHSATHKRPTAARRGLKTGKLLQACTCSSTALIHDHIEDAYPAGIRNNAAVPEV